MLQFSEDYSMYALFSAFGIRDAMQRELLPFMIALVIAQLYFKWGSFALELVGFVAVWFALGFVSERVNGALRK